MRLLRRIITALLILNLAVPAMAAERILTFDLVTGRQNAKIGFGTAGQILTSNGAGSVPTFQDAPVAMVYPGAGIPQSTGSAWGTSLTFSTDGTFADNSDANIPSQKAVKTYTDTKATKGANSDITSLSGLTTALSMDQGGTGQTTQQAAIDALTNVSAATNEHVLTKDTATGNAIFKAASGGANTALSNLADVAINTTLKSDTDNTDDLGASDKTWKDLYLSGRIYGGNNDGWSPAVETWTYASASSFTVAGDQTVKYSKGARLKFTQTTTVKYAVVISSSYSSPNTTVNILVNTDYTIANDTITSNNYSYAMNPQGYPGWFNVAAPTFTGIDNGSGGQPTGTEHRARIDGNVYKAHLNIRNCYKDGVSHYFSWASAVASVNTENRSVMGTSWWNSDTDESFIGLLINISSTARYAIVNSAQSFADNKQFGYIGVSYEHEI